MEEMKMNLFWVPLGQNLHNFVDLQFAMQIFAFCEISGQHIAVPCEIQGQHTAAQAGIGINPILQAFIFNFKFWAKISILLYILIFREFNHGMEKGPKTLSMTTMR